MKGRTTDKDRSQIVREPVLGLIMWLRPKGLKVCSYVEKYAEFKNQTLKKIGWYTKVLCANRIPPGYAISQNSAKMGVPLQVYKLLKGYPLEAKTTPKN